MKLTQPLKNLTLLIFLLGILTATGQNNKTSQLKQQQKEIEQKLSRTKNLLNETNKKAKMSLNDLSLIKNQIENRKNLINSYTTELVQIEGQIDNMSDELTQLERNLKQLKHEYAEMIRQSYKSRNSYDQWMFVFASKDFYQAMKRIKYLMEYSKYRRQKANEIIATSNRINNNLQQLGVKKNSKEVLITVKEKEAQELEKDKVVKEGTLKKLKGQEKELKKEIAKQNQEWQQLNAKIQQIIAAEIEKQRLAEIERKRKEEEKIKNNSGKTTSTNNLAENQPKKTTENNQPKENKAVKIEPAPADVKLSNDFILNQGKLPWPSERASIVSHFGKHADEDLPEIIRDNRGVDFLCEQSDAARAVFSGKVSRIISMPAGYAILIQHGTYYTVYTYLSSVSVKEGQMVDTKQRLGTIAVDPLRKETVLHFELWKGQTIQNPEVWLKR